MSPTAQFICSVTKESKKATFDLQKQSFFSRRMWFMSWLCFFLLAITLDELCVQQLHADLGCLFSWLVLWRQLRKPNGLTFILSFPRSCLHLSLWVGFSPPGPVFGGFQPLTPRAEEEEAAAEDRRALQRAPERDRSKVGPHPSFLVRSH